MTHPRHVSIEGWVRTWAREGCIAEHKLQSANEHGFPFFNILLLLLLLLLFISIALGQERERVHTGESRQKQTL